MNKIGRLFHQFFLFSFFFWCATARSIFLYHWTDSFPSSFSILCAQTMKQGLPWLCLWLSKDHEEGQWGISPSLLYTKIWKVRLAEEKGSWRDLLFKRRSARTLAPVVFKARRWKTGCLLKPEFRSASGTKMSPMGSCLKT